MPWPVLPFSSWALHFFTKLPVNSETALHAHSTAQLRLQWRYYCKYSLPRLWSYFRHADSEAKRKSSHSWLIISRNSRIFQSLNRSLSHFTADLQRKRDLLRMRWSDLLPSKPFAAQESPRDHTPKSAKALPRVPAGSIGTSSGDGSYPDIAK